MKRLAVLAIVCSFFAFGFTSCDGPKFTCANPTRMTDYQGTLHYPPYVVQQDVWSPRNGTRQTMDVCGPGNWRAIVNQTGVASDGVATYPDSQKTDTDWSASCAFQPTIGSFTRMTSSFSHVAPNAGSYDFAHDIFLNNYCGKPLIEVMIWSQWRGISVPTAQLHPTIDGVAYDLFYSGGYIQFRRRVQVSSGTVNVLHFLQYLESRGLVKASDTRQFIAYGPEVLTTGGQDVPFWLTGFSVSDAHG